MTESFTLSLFVYPNFLCTACVTVASWLFVPWKRCGRGVCHAPRRHTPTLCRLRVLTTISLCLLLLGGIFHSRIPFDVFVTIVFQRSVAWLPLSEVCNRGENRRLAITGRVYSCSKPEHPPVGDHSCTTGNQSPNLCYHNRSCPWV